MLGEGSLQDRGLLCPTRAEGPLCAQKWTPLVHHWYSHLTYTLSQAGMSHFGSCLTQESPTLGFYNASRSEGTFTGFHSIKSIKCCSLCIYYLTGGSHLSLRYSQGLHLPGHTCLEYMPRLFPFNLPFWNLAAWSKWQTVASSSLKKCVGIPSFSLVRGAV